MRKALFFCLTKYQLTLTDTFPHPPPRPAGLQLGAVVSLNIYVGIGERRQRCSPVENRKSTLICDATPEKEKFQVGHRQKE